MIFSILGKLKKSAVIKYFGPVFGKLLKIAVVKFPVMKFPVMKFPVMKFPVMKFPVMKFA